MSDDTHADYRPMVAADLDQVAALYESLVGEPPPPTWEQHVQAVISAHEAGGVAVAATSTSGPDEPRLVGYVVGEVRSWEFGSAPAGWILGLGVSTDVQGQGVARRLLHHAVTVLGRAGVSTIRTMIKRDDVPFLRLFRSGGFVAGPYTELELDLEQGGDA